MLSIRLPSDSGNAAQLPPLSWMQPSLPISHPPYWKTYPLQYYFLILEHAVTAIHLRGDRSTSVFPALPAVCPLVNLLPSPLPQRSQAHHRASLDHRCGQADPKRAHPPLVSNLRSPNPAACLAQINCLRLSQSVVHSPIGWAPGPRDSLGGVQGWPKGDGRDGAWWANYTTPNINRKCPEAWPGNLSISEPQFHLTSGSYSPIVSDMGNQQTPSYPITLT